MRKLDFNRGWTYRRAREEGAGKEIRLPHDAMISEQRTEDSAGGINTGWFEGFDYIYEKEFDVPKEYEGQYVSFEFEGIYHNAEVYLNGKKAAFRPYGYSDFYVDAAGYLKYGEKNQIRVIARNADQPNSRWYSGAGIYRPVCMYTAPAGTYPDERYPDPHPQHRSCNDRGGESELPCAGELNIQIMPLAEDGKAEPAVVTIS